MRRVEASSLPGSHSELSGQQTFVLGAVLFGWLGHNAGERRTTK